MNTIHVTASSGYDIHIGSGLLKDSGKMISDAAHCENAVIVSDDIVYPLYGEMLKKSLEAAGMNVFTFVFANGEGSKNLTVYGRLLEFMCEKLVTRDDTVVALGGGVVGDLAGFAAATYRRGMKFVQIPTTLLAAVDSSVGGKTAVNLENGKNQVGAFKQPSLVICDTDLLSTLPEEQFRCGCAEVIKYAVIGNEGFFDELCADDIHDMLEHVISVCVSMKRDTVEKDEFDRGERMLLNFGHTLGHAAEMCSGYTLLHGLGVSMGMAAITRAACRKGLCPADTAERLISLLRKYSLPTDIPYSDSDMLAAALSDKKRGGDTLSLIVPEKIGRCVIRPVAVSELPMWLSSEVTA